jgi:hypothetical protein
LLPLGGLGFRPSRQATLLLLVGLAVEPQVVVVVAVEPQVAYLQARHP